MDEKKALKRFRRASLTGLVLLGSFFAYGFYFDLWGKEFSDMPRILYYGLYVYLVLFIVFLLRYISIVGEVGEICNKKERNR
jgi:hypothetical protein